MSKENHLADGILYVNKDNPGEYLILNFYSWVEIIKGIMVFYGEKTEEEAKNIINNTPMFNTPPANYLEACMLGHEDEYYWAMVMSHGERYFDKRFDSSLPGDYYEWEDGYIKARKLACNTFTYNH